jgi:hypothetical protein
VLSLLRRLLREPSILLRAPRVAVRSQIGDVSAIATPHPRLWVAMRALGRFSRLRKLGIKLSKPLPPEAVERGEATSFGHVSVEDTVRRLEADGIAEGIDLPPDTREAILDYARQSPFAVNRAGGPTTSLDAVEAGDAPEGLTLGEYEHPSESPEVDRLARDPVLLDIAERYLGVPPRHIGTRLWWSFPTDATAEQQSAASQLFHFDLDDFRFLKFFFYLTDVDESAGPHVAVLGTHARKRFSHQAVIRRLTDEEVDRAYGADRVRTIRLPAGSGFAEDTFCLHKGRTPTGAPRLLLQLEYGVNDFHSGA